MKNEQTGSLFGENCLESSLSLIFAGELHRNIDFGSFWKEEGSVDEVKPSGMMKSEESPLL